MLLIAVVRALQHLDDTGRPLELTVYLNNFLQAVVEFEQFRKCN